MLKIPLSFPISTELSPQRMSSCNEKYYCVQHVYKIVIIVVIIIVVVVMVIIIITTTLIIGENYYPEQV